MDFKLKSGRELCANRGIFGLTPELELTDGYDEDLLFTDENALTPGEREEIADIMIDRWQRWKAQ